MYEGAALTAPFARKKKHMGHFGRYFLPFALWMVCFALHGQGDTTRLRVMTYNLRFGERASLEELAATISAGQPDLVALQEVDCKTARPIAPHQHGRDFATELGYRTGMLPLYGKTIPHAGGLYGIGMLSALPYIGVRKTMLPRRNETDEQRAMLAAEVETAQGDTIVFVSTHLHHRGAESRLEQIEALVREAATFGRPVLLGGDFNAKPDERTIRFLLENGWKMLCGTDPTFPADRPSVRIDYLFGYPAQEWELESTEVGEAETSDHRPVISVVRLVR